MLRRVVALHVLALLVVLGPLGRSDAQVLPQRLTVDVVQHH